MTMDILKTAGPKAKNGVSRRSILRTAGAVGVAAAGFGIVGPKAIHYAIAGNAPKVRLAWTEVAACHSPVAFGVAKGIYAKQVDVELFYQGASGQTLIQSLATRKADAGAGLLYDWLKPIEQGFDVKLFVGSHGGCQRLLASKARASRRSTASRARRSAPTMSASPPKHSFSVALAKAGLDPERDVTWKGVPVRSRRRSASIAARRTRSPISIPGPIPTRSSSTSSRSPTPRPASSRAASAACSASTAPSSRPTRTPSDAWPTANLEIHEYTADHPDEVAKWYLREPQARLPARGPDEVAGLASTITTIWFGKDLDRRRCRLATEDLKLTSVIDADDRSGRDRQSRHDRHPRVT